MALLEGTAPPPARGALAADARSATGRGEWPRRSRTRAGRPQLAGHGRRAVPGGLRGGQRQRSADLARDTRDGVPPPRWGLRCGPLPALARARRRAARRPAACGKAPPAWGPSARLAAEFRLMASAPLRVELVPPGSATASLPLHRARYRAPSAPRGASAATY